MPSRPAPRRSFPVDLAVFLAILATGVILVLVGHVSPEALAGYASALMRPLRRLPPPPHPHTTGIARDLAHPRRGRPEGLTASDRPRVGARRPPFQGGSRAPLPVSGADRTPQDLPGLLSYRRMGR